MNTPIQDVIPSAKQQFLSAYEKEHAITMRVLRAYPVDRLDLQPHPKLKTAREIAFIFVLERFLGIKVYNDGFADPAAFAAAGPPPAPPASWDELLAALENAHTQFGDLIRATPEAELHSKVHFLTGPKQMGLVTRLEFCWFLLSDQIHHRGQFSVYLRMADGKVPSIYGPTADEPWM